MSNYSVIGKVTNSSRKMSARRIQKFDQYCKNAYIFRLKNIKYWPMNKSIHRLWSHCARKMQQLGYSLGLISENSLERMVRFILLIVLVCFLPLVIDHNPDYKS